VEHELHEYTNGTNEEKVVYKELSFKIIEACFEVHNILGPGYSEKIYEEAVSKELRNRGIGYERQKLVEVYYKGEKIGEYRLDLVLENKIILELKAVSELSNIFEAQLLSYLKAAGMKLGILVNFGSKKVIYRRIVN
jgi:GxxExxY protein